MKPTLNSQRTLVICFFVAALVFAMGGCQSRVVSRISGDDLKLELPDDFVRPISFASGREGEKDLFYEAADGSFRVKTYTDSSFFESGIVFVQTDKSK